MIKKHLLFVCTSNISRSPTAESLFKKSNKYETKSAGIKTFVTPIRHTIQINQDLIDWADEIVVMSERNDGHETFIRHKFNLKEKKVIDLKKHEV